MSLISVAVGSALEVYGLKYQVLRDSENAGGRQWTHEFYFKAYDKAVEGTWPLCIGHCERSKYIVNWGEDATAPPHGDGWTHDSVIYVFGTPQPGTEPFSVCHATGNWRWRIVSGPSVGDSDWTYDFTFWAYPQGFNPQGDTLAVGRFGSKFCLLKDKDFDSTWNKVFKFRAAPINEPGLAPISVYQETKTWRSKVVQGQKSGKSDEFIHSLTFYAHNFQTPGTVPITVSHTDNPLRYRLNWGPSCADEPGWTQDFVFYALPSI